MRLPDGHVAAALGMLRKIALDQLMLSMANDAASRRHCDLVVAMILDRLIAPRSKLGFVRAVDEENDHHSGHGNVAGGSEGARGVRGARGDHPGVSEILC
jgi:hypothetical protein